MLTQSPNWSNLEPAFPSSKTPFQAIIAMVAMTPLITIQILGMTYQLKQRHASRTQQAYVDAFASLPEDAIIEL